MAQSKSKGFEFRGQAGLDYLSPSQIDMFCRCPKQWEYRYIEKLVIAPDIGLSKGSSVHEAASMNGSQKIVSRTDLPISDVVDAAVQDFHKREEGIELRPEEKSLGRDTVLGRAADSVAGYATLYAEEISPNYQPTLVEKKFRIETSGPALAGIVDMIDERRSVVDFKTSSRKKNQDDVDNSVQLTAYAAAHYNLTGDVAEDMRFEVLVENKSGHKSQRLLTTRTDADMNALAARMNVISGAIRAGSFPPAMPGTWWCSKRFCGYADRCPFVNFK